MNHGTYVFAQVMQLIHWQSFARHVDRYNGNYRVQNFTCWHQFLCMSFGQLTNRESLRDIVNCLQAHEDKLYHLGLTNGVKRSTLADANERRDYRIYQDLAQSLIVKARKLYQGKLEEVDLDNVIYALDSTTIELCLEVFWWAKFRKHKAAVKLHTLLDVRCEIPCFVHVSDGKFHDVNVLDILEFEPEAFYVMDRGYVDWKRLYRIHLAGAFFVIRAKKNLAFERVYSRSVDKLTGLRCDQTIRLVGHYAVLHYPEHLRRVKYFDAEHQVTYVYLTNHFEAKPMEIVTLYLNRWKVEIFFKWIKQHLRIKRFWGESPNAVKTQIWIAI
ncbi:MAG: IS4 family transposase, partial [Xanthomonadales bacterium]|nr:IS4 family transposase [Xanthomonadales bacterium]